MTHDSRIEPFFRLAMVSELRTARAQRDSSRLAEPTSWCGRGWRPHCATAATAALSWGCRCRQRGCVRGVAGEGGDGSAARCDVAVSRRSAGVTGFWRRRGAFGGARQGIGRDLRPGEPEGRARAGTSSSRAQVPVLMAADRSGTTVSGACRSASRRAEARPAGLRGDFAPPPRGEPRSSVRGAQSGERRHSRSTSPWHRPAISTTT